LLLSSVHDRVSAPSYMFIVDKNIDIFRGVSYHREAKLIADGLLHDNWRPLIEENILIDGRQFILEWYQDKFLRLCDSTITEKSRRIGFTTIATTKRTLRSQFIPISFHSVSLTQKHTEATMDIHDSIYDQMPARWRAHRILDRVDEKDYLILGNKHGAHLRSKVYAHACSSESVRGLEGDIDFDEFAFYPPKRQQAMLKMVVPIFNTTYRHYNDIDRHFLINFISTHNGDTQEFARLASGDHPLAKAAGVVHLKLPWQVSHRVAKNIVSVVEGMDYEEYLEEMCCIPLKAKDSPFPPQLYYPLLKDIEFDQFGIRVFRDATGKVLPFNSKRYEFISVGWDYASFKSETTGYGFGKIGNRYETVFFYRMNPNDFGGSIPEEEIWKIVNTTSQIMRPNYLGYDDTGVGAYLSRVLFDPEYGTGPDRIPRTDLYPYAEGAEPVKFTNEYKGSNVTKLKTAMALRLIVDLPLDEEVQKQFRRYKRSITSSGLIRYSADGKGKVAGARDDIPSAMIIAISPFHIEDRPALTSEEEVHAIQEILEVRLFDEIAGSNDIFLPIYN